MAASDEVARQRKALKNGEDAAYAALKSAEDELFALEDRIGRRGERPSIEGGS